MSNRVLVLLVALFASLLDAGCGSSTADSAVARSDARAFRCPPAAAVASAVGEGVAAPYADRRLSRSVMCAYSRPELLLIVSVTFGSVDGEYASIDAAADGRRISPVHGVGEAAKQIAPGDDLGRMLIVRTRDRIVDVTVEPGRDSVAAETRLARLFTG